jgi:hypothetical protein
MTFANIEPISVCDEFFVKSGIHASFYFAYINILFLGNPERRHGSPAQVHI